MLVWSAAILFAVSGAVSAYILFFAPHGELVEIVSDGQVLYTLDLSKEKKREITIEYQGRKNIIAVENGDIYMKEADCPDHICINTGRLRSSGVPIVCLPNRLIIRYKNSGGDGIDAAAG